VYKLIYLLTYLLTNEEDLNMLQDDKSLLQTVKNVKSICLVVC